MQTICVIDDEEQIRQSLEKYLSMKGYKVYSAKSIETAKEIISNNNLDYATVDLKLDASSEYGGVQLFPIIKKNRPNTKIITVSAYPFEEIKKELKEQLQNLSDHDRIMKEIEENYVSKGGEKNYILAILDKLKK